MPLDDATYASILAQVANGDLVTDVAKAHGSTRVQVWKRSEADGDGTYTRARVAQAHSMAEDTVKLADDMSIPADQKRIMVETRKWLITKIAPRLYGDRLDVQATVQHTVSGVIALPDEDVPLPRSTVTARVLTSEATRGDEAQAVDASHVDASDLAQHVSDGPSSSDT